MKKVISLLMAIMMTIAFSTNAFADVNITIERDDSTYEEGGISETGNRVFMVK